jgi:porphobilinogen deaminase
VLTTNGEIQLRALVAEADGSRILRAEGLGAEPGPLAQELVEQLLSQGADSILANARDSY